MMSPRQTNGHKTSQQRFQETMGYGSPDHVPLFEEGIREEVISAWQTQGLSPDTDLSERFHYDRRREIQVDMEPHPALEKRPTTRAELNAFRKSLNPADPARLSKTWQQLVESCQSGDATVMLNVHRGFFQTVGVHSGAAFMDVMNLVIDRPQLIRDIMMIQGEFSARLAERILGEINADTALFSEPIGGNDKPLISPSMYEDLVLQSYEPTLEVLKRCGVKTIIFRTYANARVLIPSILKWGFNCLWAVEASLKAMDYRSIRRDFGRGLRLIGGIDLDILRQSNATIKRVVEEKVPRLLKDRGYLPLANGRVREDVPFENYVYYRQLLADITAA